MDSNKGIVPSYFPLPVSPWKYTIHVDTPVNHVGLNQREGFESVTEMDCVVPIKVKRHFRKLVVHGVKNSKFFHRVNIEGAERKIEPLSDSPVVTFTVKQCDGVDINIDLAPMINVKLPFKDIFDWLNNVAKWPSQEKVQQLKNNGVNLVTSDPLFWKLSFAICERELLVDIDRNGSGTCRRRSLRIMKRLRELFWCPDYEDRDGLTSYHLKNLLFLECERLAKDYQWNIEMMDERDIGMCEQLQVHLSAKHMPQFFNRPKHLFENKDNKRLNLAAINLNQFLHCPENYL
ncbi:unnamed protein product [Mytilus coruscus]|uniref:Uncharacterized protein n=1 Tax=Mytilus coruscus TaxID=42192 RepID=A0A6J8C8D6_MYTCO|nr:unnamed protein product [Mytilus coruscus]